MTLHRGGRVEQAAALWAEAKRGHRTLEANTAIKHEVPAAAGLIERLYRETESCLQSQP